MEKFYGLTSSTLELMLKDLQATYLVVLYEMRNYPDDSFLPTRGQRIITDIVELMNELHNRANV